MIYRTITVEVDILGGLIEVEPELTGDIDVEIELTGDIDVEAELCSVIAYSNAKTYDGAYEVTPMADEEQVLVTAQKLMADDVTIHKVPYYETSNEHGITVYIAEGV